VLWQAGVPDDPEEECGRSLCGRKGDVEAACWWLASGRDDDGSVGSVVEV
jgi:hypothetical protein